MDHHYFDKPHALFIYKDGREVIAAVDFPFPLTWRLPMLPTVTPVELEPGSCSTMPMRYREFQRSSPSLVARDYRWWRDLGENSMAPERVPVYFERPSRGD